MKFSYVSRVVDDQYIAEQFAGIAQGDAASRRSYAFNMEQELLAQFHLENEWLLGKQMQY